MDWVFAARLGAAAALGAVLGLERELRGQVAGFRTHILVATGACLFTLAGAFGFSDSHMLSEGGSRSDVTRVASQVVVGIGFLGAGAIVHFGASVRGLTTAANLWVAAALGLACGAGFYSAAVMTAGISLLVLSGLKPLERWIRKKRGKRPLRDSIQADVTQSHDRRRKFTAPPGRSGDEHPATPHSDVL